MIKLLDTHFAVRSRRGDARIVDQNVKLIASRTLGELFVKRSEKPFDLSRRDQIGLKGKRLVSRDAIPPTVSSAASELRPK